MRIQLCLALPLACVLCAQTPNLSGVWKANLEKSKLQGQPPQNFLMIIEQDGSTLKETQGRFTERGEQRSEFTYNLGDKPSMNSYNGMALRTQAAWDGGALVLTSKLAAQKPGAMIEKYTLSADGNTLTVVTSLTGVGHDFEQTAVFDKQPDAAGEPLRKPEQTAGAHYKNIQVMKDVPASHLIDAMGSFTLALGVDCMFCHVQGKFDADDKPAKLTARKMIAMTHAINEQNFNGRMEVHCYTCHKGAHHPASHPSFE